MKPRLFDGEHLHCVGEHPQRLSAAMKPRLFDGEHEVDLTEVVVLDEPQ